MKTADYGVDAPGVIRNLRLTGFGLLLVGASTLLIPRIGNFRWLLFSIFVTYGASFALTSLLMFVYAKVGKLRHRDFLLGLYQFRGDESVLDIGTGAGLLAIGAAKKTPNGKVTGVDIWNTEDLSDNSKARAVENAKLEGVAKRVEILREDARQLSLPDQSFDLVVSNLCLHNIEDEKGRESACLEIARVLKTGGVALVSDFSRTAEYQKVFQKAGLLVDKKRSPWFKTLAFPPMTILRAQKAPAIA